MLVAQLCPTLRTMDCQNSHQGPWSMGLPRPDYRSGLPFPSQGELPDSGIKPGSPALQADALPSEPQGKPPGWGGGRGEEAANRNSPDSALKVSY